MDAVASEAPEPSDTTETNPEGVKPGWRDKIPTKLLATLLGIALTAWLLPAFTRQWDDRQKAHELKVALVDDTTSATATAEVSGTTRAKRAEAWFRASDSIEARLGAYFGPEVVAAWQIYSYLVDELLEAGGDAQAESSLTRALIWLYGAPSNIFSGEVPDRPHWRPFDPAVAGAAAVALAALKASRQKLTGTEEYQGNLVFHALMRNIERQDKADVTFFTHGDFKEGNVDARRAFEIELLTLQTRVAGLSLASHPTGFSTTRSDLIRDLLPV